MRRILRCMETTAAPVRSQRIFRFENGALAGREDRVSVEEPLEIRVGATTLAVTMRTPGHDFELAAGWLVSEGIVRRPEEIVRIEHCRQVRSAEEEGNVVLVRTTEPAGAHVERARRMLVTSSSCGLCGKGSIESIRGEFPSPDPRARFDASVLLGLPGTLRTRQASFAETGGLHAAGIFTLSGELVVCREDIGRHNAVDKAIGALFRQGRLPLSETILLVSGRASFEIVQKALAAAIPIVAAVSAPSSLAVMLAEDAGMTLAGFVRGGACNLYAGHDRVRGAAGAREAANVALGRDPDAPDADPLDFMARPLRAALDEAGYKISLADWRALTRNERRRLVTLVEHASREDFATYLVDRITARTGTPPRGLARS